MKHPTAASVLLLIAGTCTADVLNVPADYPTIQAGIDAAAAGDTVLVADGDYWGPGNYDIDTLGKAITVKSVNGSKHTWIYPDDESSGFLVHSGETVATVIQGFTVESYEMWWVNDIFVSDASPTIIDYHGYDEIVLENSSAVVTGSGSWYGFTVTGGAPTLIGCGGSAWSTGAALTLSGCNFSGNYDLYGLYASGGSVDAPDCKFSDNQWYAGGARLSGVVATLDSCDFSRNVDEGDGARGGGIAIYASTATLAGCTFRDNKVGLEGQGGGGGAYVDGASDAAFIGCLFQGNLAYKHYDVGGYGGAVHAAGKALYVNCAFIANSGRWGGAIHSEGQDRAVNCTFYGNKATIGKAIAGYAGTVVTSCVMSGHGAETIWGTPAITYSNVEGGYAGVGNISADPEFIDPAGGRFDLAPGSPCIDAGDNTAVPDGVLTDYAGEDRFVDDPATADTGVGPGPVVDMGAHEFGGACYADFDGSGVLNLFDFLAFVNAFNAEQEKADCADGDGLNLFDFLCFTNAYNAGC